MSKVVGEPDLNKGGIPVAQLKNGHTKKGCLILTSESEEYWKWKELVKFWLTVEEGIKYPRIEIRIPLTGKVCGKY